MVRDSCGTSDPYVKFKIDGKTCYRSRTVMRNLNPKWDEKFSVMLDDLSKTIDVRVYDYDRGLRDDWMGSATIQPSQLPLNVSTDLTLELKDTKKKSSSEKYMGCILIQCTVTSKSSLDYASQYFRRMTCRSSGSASGSDTISLSGLSTATETRKVKVQRWNGVVTVVLVEGRGLLPKDDNGFSDPYVKFQLGKERYKSKYKYKTLNPRWLEQFDLYMYEDQSNHLEITVFDYDVSGRDDFMGRAVINLTEMETERTHRISQKLEDDAGTLLLLITVSGMTCNKHRMDQAGKTIDDLRRDDIVRQYGVIRSLQNIRDVGWLQVKVLRAHDLKSADLGGKSDPYCVLELVNERLQTHTEYKTLSPDWHKVFVFKVTDIHAILEITVYDEDADKKVEFLGKLAIPLLQIQCGKTRWYKLKDKKLKASSQGSLQLELDFVFNHFKAAIRTFNPRELKYMAPEPKFRWSAMKHNINRVQKHLEVLVNVGEFLQSCFRWKSKIRTIVAFAVYVIVVYNFELYMLPLTVIVIFLSNLLLVWYTELQNKDTDAVDADEEEDDEEEEEKKEKAQSLLDRLQSIQDALLQLQGVMDYAASTCERVKNAFGWSVPWLSILAIVVLSIAAVILYYIPLRWLALAWGINKFTKKLRAPNAIDNNELLDYLSRVPSNRELLEYRELKLDAVIARKR